MKFLILIIAILFGLAAIAFLGTGLYVTFEAMFTTPEVWHTLDWTRVFTIYALGGFWFYLAAVFGKVAEEMWC